MSAELVSRLNAKTNFPQPQQGRTQDPITAQDVAGAIGMARLPPGPDYLVRVKFALQEQYRTDLSISLHMRLSDLHDYSYLSRRKEHTTGLVKAICWHSISDFLDSKVCPYCNGTTETMTIEGLKIKCTDCGGVGVRSGGRQAIFIALASQNYIPWRTFQRHWWPLVKDSLDILGRWERVGLAAMKLIR